MLDWCTCSRSKTDGYTNIGNQIWVHATCMKPTQMFWENVVLRDRIENELDMIIEMIFDKRATEKDIGAAEAYCHVLALINNPTKPNLVAVKDAAIKRYKDRTRATML